ncbi:unnamed protein product [Pleuronectes platessa]|uniref:Uncharacterized protein n=1 Tax=Pleuronectes platessa TaxID=8262 RepID=A0A9N7TYI6_PLEPL|nr:unnamed protein product [Pleuronectes platessa]
MNPLHLRLHMFTAGRYVEYVAGTKVKPVLWPPLRTALGGPCSRRGGEGGRSPRPHRCVAAPVTCGPASNKAQPKAARGHDSSVRRKPVGNRTLRRIWTRVERVFRGEKARVSAARQEPPPPGARRPPDVAGDAWTLSRVIGSGRDSMRVCKVQPGTGSTVRDVQPGSFGTGITTSIGCSTRGAEETEGERERERGHYRSSSKRKRRRRSSLRSSERKHWAPAPSGMTDFSQTAH